MNVVLQIDSQITQFIYGLIPHNQFFNLFFSFFSLRGNSVLIWIVIVLFLLIFEEIKHRHRFVILFLVSFLVTGFLVNTVIKNIVQRPRPSIRISSCRSGYSFPSGHASTAFAAATVIAFYDKKRRWIYYLIAGLIGLSRIYLGCHYFLDALFGSLFGYIISRLILMKIAEPFST